MMPIESADGVQAVTTTRNPSSADRIARRNPAEPLWLDLAAVADATIVAEGGRVARRPDTWSADRPGEQTIEIKFHQPISLSRLRVVSSEPHDARTQQMTVWVSLHRGERHREIVRQQFNFSPNGATQEVEEYVLQLEGVTGLQLRIVPSIDGRRLVARVNELRLA